VVLNQGYRPLELPPISCGFSVILDGRRGVCSTPGVNITAKLAVFCFSGGFYAHRLRRKRIRLLASSQRRIQTHPPHPFPFTVCFALPGLLARSPLARSPPSPSPGSARERGRRGRPRFAGGGGGGGDGSFRGSGGDSRSRNLAHGQGQRARRGSGNSMAMPATHDGDAGAAVYNGVPEGVCFFLERCMLCWCCCLMELAVVVAAAVVLV